MPLSFSGHFSSFIPNRVDPRKRSEEVSTTGVLQERKKTHILAFCCQPWPELSRPGLQQTPEDVAPVAEDPLSSEKRGSMDQTGISRKKQSAITLR